ncbi:MAG: DnaJ domain-containing protein [Oricola sp.]|nr:DnaJ domain-containing protein [Oricola sp.]
MGLAFIAILTAVAAAGWLLFRLAGNRDDRSERPMTAMKLVAWLALTAVLLAAKLWPLAFMVLIAAGGVTAIEAWRARAGGDAMEDRPAAAPPAKRMSEDEALSVLGLKPGAKPEEIRAAHRKLIAQLHPDKGGTDYLAAKINEARDYLLRRSGAE